MYGIGSDETNESSTSQQNEAEIQVYVSGSSITRFYGNDGNPGTGVSEGPMSLDVSTYDAIRIRFEGVGEIGEKVKVWALSGNTISDWLDETNQILDYTVTTIGSDATNVMPFITAPNGGDYRIAAVRVTDT